MIKVERIKFNCEICGKHKEIPPSKYNLVTHHFCSRKCFSKWHKKIFVKCKVCCKNIKSPKTKLRIVCSNKCFKKHMHNRRLSEGNPLWKDGGVGKHALHKWLTARIKKPTLCHLCRKRKPYDLANISPKYNKETYTRDLSNWEWLCRRCHMESDGRLNNLKQYKSL